MHKNFLSTAIIYYVIFNFFNHFKGNRFTLCLISSSNKNKHDRGHLPIISGIKATHFCSHCNKTLTIKPAVFDDDDFIFP